MDWSFDGGRPIYTQLVEQIERAVVTGAYAPGTRLPGVRELASEAGVNPNTMQRALAELETRGLLHTQRTSGRYVTENLCLITDLRQQLACGISSEYVRAMRRLGCNNGEIKDHILKASTETIEVS